MKFSRRQRLHILYLVNDLLHHGKYHAHDQTVRGTLTQSLQPFVVELVRLGAAEAKSRVARRLSDVVELWAEEEYFGPEIIAQLQGALTGTTQETTPAEEPTSRAKELPYLLPPTHGDPSWPYYDLPAGNLMRHIVPNSSQPMRIHEIRALQLSAGPADDSLVNALKDFLKDVDGIEGSLWKLEEAGLSPELDELGQISYRDEAGALVGDTYYGWSRAFCEKMKKRGKRGSEGSSQRSRSRSTDRSRSTTPRKRRRRSNSSRGRSPSSDSYSRSLSRPRYGGRRQKNGSRSASRSRSKSGSYSPEYSPKLVHSLGSEPARTSVSTGASLAGPSPALPPPAAAPPASTGVPFPPLPFTASGLPVPPPRPPHWTGLWPPPPPPQFSQGLAGYQNLPLPPPPPPNYPYPPANWPAYPNVPPGQNNNYPGGR
ncbi:hypothetical protein, variant [Phialophora macrospora]|nr:hypothetical protein, variant [Phialophora macrospora]